MINKNAKTYETGERIISEGDDATNTYIILSGTVCISIEKDGKTVTLANLGIGDMFGESALFGNNKYGANVDVTETTTLIVISPEDFKEKLESCDPMIQNMFKILMERLNKTNKALVDSETRTFMDVIFV
ncbi:MAG: cyclic nucleotide-binding domain-containing protein [Alphaproteobacteria bacterium]|nr:cyclic nucleotide-binding domain-containing protein [Alphaproteobacteria bacterium]